MDIEEASAMPEASGLASGQNKPSTTRPLAEARPNSQLENFSAQLGKLSSGVGRNPLHCKESNTEGRLVAPRSATVPPTASCPDRS